MVVAIRSAALHATHAAITRTQPMVVAEFHNVTKLHTYS